MVDHFDVRIECVCDVFECVKSAGYRVRSAGYELVTVCAPARACRCLQIPARTVSREEGREAVRAVTPCERNRAADASA